METQNHEIHPLKKFLIDKNMPIPFFVRASKLDRRTILKMLEGVTFPEKTVIEKICTCTLGQITEESLINWYMLHGIKTKCSSF